MGSSPEYLSPRSSRPWVYHGDAPSPPSCLPTLPSTDSREVPRVGSSQAKAGPRVGSSQAERIQQQGGGGSRNWRILWAPVAVLRQDWAGSGLAPAFEAPTSPPLTMLPQPGSCAG
jgi:hypothetical protein